MEIILLIIGLLLGVWGFSVLILPLVYGFPKAIYWTTKGLLKKSSAPSCLISPAIWTIVFVILFFALNRFAPSMANRLSESSGFQWGIISGVVLMIFRSFSKSGQKDLREDFWSFVEKHIDSEHPENAESNKFYLASQIAGQAAQFAMQKDHNYALKLFKKAIEIKDDYVDAYLGIAMTCQNKNDIVRAIKILEDAPQEMRLGDLGLIKDAKVDIHTALGGLYSIIGEKEKAIKSLENALVILEDPQTQQKLESHKKANKIIASYTGSEEDFFGAKGLEEIESFKKQIKERIKELKKDY